MQPQYIDAEELKEILRAEGSAATKKVQVIDVRDDDFSAGGNIKGALNFPSSMWGEAETTEKIYAELVDRNADCVVFHW